MVLDDEKTHPAYGMISAHRTTGNVENLFGSVIRQHHSTIRIELKEGLVSRDLSQHWFRGGKIIAEVEMSHAQFAEFITTMNMGDGVPCTILYRHKGEFTKVEPPPPTVPETENVKADFKEQLEDIMTKSKSRLNQLDKLLAKKTLKKDDKAQIRAIVGGLHRFLWDSAPFISDQFSRAAEKIVTVAKSEVDAFVTSMIHRTGLKELQRIQSVLTDSDESEPPQLTDGATDQK